MTSLRITSAPTASVTVGAWARDSLNPHQMTRSAWISASGAGTVASARVIADFDDSTLTVRLVDERLQVLHFPTETVHHNISINDLLTEGERHLLEIACEHLRHAAAHTIEVSTHG